MIRVRVRMGAKGQLVIPKVIRESLGLTKNKIIILEMRDKTLEIKGIDEEIPEKWEAVAKREGLDVTKNLVYGDKLYTQVFG